MSEISTSAAIRARDRAIRRALEKVKLDPSMSLEAGMELALIYFMEELTGRPARSEADRGAGHEPG